MGLLLKICISVKEYYFYFIFYFIFFCKDQLLQDKKKRIFIFLINGS